MTAHKMSNIKPQECHEELMAAFDKQKSMLLALDKSGKVMQEYKEKLGDDSTGAQWLLHIMDEGAYEQHDLITFPKPIRFALDKARPKVHQSDRKFAALGASTPTQVLVAEEYIW